MKIVKETLFESPDIIQADNLEKVTQKPTLDWNDLGTYAFGYFKNKMLIADKNEPHYSVELSYNIENDPDAPSMSRSDMKATGRIWMNEKLISFWKYPQNKNLLFKILKDIQVEFHDRFPDERQPLFFDDDWFIEIISDKLPNNKINKFESDWAQSLNSAIIPINDYKGSDDQSIEAMKKGHIESPMNKLKPKNISDYIKSGIAKRKPLKWKQALLKSESLDELTFEDINEKLLVGEPINIEELRDLLRQKIVNFEFIKLDGNVRPARGTVIQKYVPSEEQPTGENPSSDKVAAFYDLDKNAWRSVSNRSKEVVLDVDKETGKPKIVISDKIPKTEDPAKKLMPKEKDVEQRLITPKAEPIVKPSIKPEVVPQISKVSEIEPEVEEKPLNIEDPNISAEEVESDDIIVTTQEPEDIEEKPIVADTTIPMEPKVEPIVKPTITSDVPVSSPSGPQPALLPDEEIKLPPKEDITFPEEEEEEID